MFCIQYSLFLIKEQKYSNCSIQDYRKVELINIGLSENCHQPEKGVKRNSTLEKFLILKPNCFFQVNLPSDSPEITGKLHPHYGYIMVMLW